MKKLIITMIAIAFSLSAFSAIRVMDKVTDGEGNTMSVWCIHEDFVFVEINGGALVQIRGWDDGDKDMPIDCQSYESRKNDPRSIS